MLEYMETKEGDEYSLTLEDFQKVLVKFCSKETRTYDFLIKSGERYKVAFFNICKRIIEDEDIPINFHITSLNML